MPGTRQTNTFGESLQKMLRDLADMKVMPDADMPFIVDLETQIIGELRKPIDGSIQAGASQVPSPTMAPQGMPMAGGPPGGMPPGGMPPGAGPAPGRGPSVSPSMPNPDELRRLLGASS